MISPGGSAPRCRAGKGRCNAQSERVPLGSVFAWIEALVLHGCVQEVQVQSALSQDLIHLLEYCALLTVFEGSGSTEVLDEGRLVSVTSHIRRGFVRQAKS